MAESRAFSETLWKAAFDSVKSYFQIHNLMPEQEQAIRAFFERDDVFVNLPTGYGKSLIYQCLPIVADVLYQRPLSSSVVLVISPLKALMADQVQHLNDLGIPAVALSDQDDPEILQQVMNGVYLIVFCSPESVLSTVTGRGILSDAEFQSRLVGVAVDEAHCIIQWGLAGTKKTTAFRKWYACLGELRSLIPTSCNLIILTATATQATKKEILDSLHILQHEVTLIEQSPNKKNLFYSKQYLDKNEPLETQFGNLLKEIEEKGIETSRTLVYCQTRKQCTVLYRLFEVYLKAKIYFGAEKPQNRMVEMFHAGTPKPVKEHITQDMASETGHIRVLISTVAFGMGIDCKNVQCIVHFGPPKNIESYVQECGRAGRNGLPSVCVLLYNGLLSVHCDTDMKVWLQDTGCNRCYLMKHFGFEVDQTDITLHNCCNYCAERCNCGEEHCGVFWNPQLKSSPNMMEGLCEQSNVRTVSAEDKKTLKEKLKGVRQQMLNQVQVENMVTCPNLILEFNAYHINQVLQKSHCLFSLNDIFRNVEIWRSKYAVAILRILGEVFGDIDIDTDMLCEDLDGEDTVMSDWSQVRDDSTLAEMLDSQDLECTDSLMDSQNESDRSLEI